MINEWEEFCAYTGTVSYTASKKSDTTWLGRFTFATILEFEGMARILTILARGYLFHSKDGAVIWGDPHDRIDYARCALCAWCSVPTESVCRVRSGSSRRIFRSCIQSSRSWWMQMGSAGSSVMFSARRTSC